MAEAPRFLCPLSFLLFHRYKLQELKFLIAYKRGYQLRLNNCFALAVVTLATSARGISLSKAILSAIRGI